MKLGIIGLTNAGKTTVFEILTKNIPEVPNKTERRLGTVTVPDDRVGKLSEIYKPKKTIYAQVEYHLPGMQDSKKQDIWNHVRDCDALIHVVRNFSGQMFDKATPYEDFVKLDQELILADLVVVEKRFATLNTEIKRGRKINTEEFSLLQECQQMLEKEIPLRRNPTLAGSQALRGFTFLSGKPLLILFNNEDENNRLPEIKDLASVENCMMIMGKLEHELAQMTPEEAVEFLKEFEIKTQAAELVIQKSYQLLGLISFFTVGEDEVRAWTIKKDTVAVDAADAIHSDIKKGFIRAEVLAYDDLITAGNYAEARKKGTVRLEGKTYLVKDGDIIEFRFNV